MPLFGGPDLGDGPFHLLGDLVMNLQLLRLNVVFGQGLKVVLPTLPDRGAEVGNRHVLPDETRVELDGLMVEI